MKLQSGWKSKTEFFDTYRKPALNIGKERVITCHWDMDEKQILLCNIR